MNGRSKIINRRNRKEEHDKDHKKPEQKYKVDSIVIQAKVTNNSLTVDGRPLGNVAFVVAESSEEAIQPSISVPIKLLPYKASGSAWCALMANPNRMEGTAILTCELRYTVMGVDTATGTPLTFGAVVSGRNFVEELQDLEVSSSNFS